jgi:folate-binding protein YgfZ
MPLIYTPRNWNWVTLSGPDARDFLQRVTTADLRSLEIGNGTRGCFLTPQGRLRSYFHLWRYGEDEFNFEFDGGEGGRWREELLSAIDQMTFAERMTLTPVHQLECRWIFSETGGEPAFIDLIQAGQTLATADGIRLSHEGKSDFGRPWITAWGLPETIATLDTLKKFKKTDRETLEAWRVEAMTPAIDHELTAQTVPLEAGLLGAIASNKGCYPGQEVIEKIISLGSPAKRLALIEGSGPAPTLPAALMNTAEPASEVGSLTTVVPSKEAGKNLDWTALGYVRKNYAKEGLEVQIAGMASRGIIKKIAPYEKSSETK